jgi:hypothetical protein
MRRLVVTTMLVALLATVLAPDAKADADSATHYCLSLGDSLAASCQETPTPVLASMERRRALPGPRVGQSPPPAGCSGGAC